MNKETAKQPIKLIPGINFLKPVELENFEEIILVTQKDLAYQFMRFTAPGRKAGQEMVVLTREDYDIIISFLQIHSTSMSALNEYHAELSAQDVEEDDEEDKEGYWLQQFLEAAQIADLGRPYAIITVKNRYDEWMERHISELKLQTYDILKCMNRKDLLEYIKTNELDVPVTMSDTTEEIVKNIVAAISKFSQRQHNG